ncbi:MFS transporter [Pantoea phytobeneficialis]|uniref:MFS transporter n=1 Tax=Pantoea phytobeneficialis TaxID=2052056 RepID=A0AAP9H4Z1_9GAMM|nr:MFS transporter [Pantoea phytobeneficialis]MDO6406032.1 MFS transporter [Pantoea phytobeneficialis]QGR06649.1 MFS transporter [Pantoea phytobeneficialis]
MPHPSSQPTAPAGSTLWLALLVALTFFMENLDATVIVTAIPQMAREFVVGPVALNVGISAYLLAVAIFIPISGWLAGRFGARNLFAAAILLFTLASVLCGVSDNLPLFTFSRVLQGIGGALMVPVGRMVVLGVTAKKQMVKTIAVITWPGLIAPVLGPPLGGLIVTYGHWSWIFWLNIPLGILALVATWWLVPQSRNHALRPFDGLGFVYTALACVTLVSGLELLGHSELTSGLLLLVVGIASAVLSYRHSLRHPAPLLPFGTLAIPTFRSTAIAGSYFRASINAIPFLLPLLFQLSFGWSAVQAGSMVLWVFAGNLAMKPATTWLMNRFGFRRILLWNGLISLLAVLSCVLLSPSLSYFAIATILFIGGLTRSLQFSCYNSLGFADVPQEKMADASVIFSIFFQFSMSAGIAISALLMRISMGWRDSNVPGQMDVNVAFIGISLLVACSLVNVWRLEKNAGQQLLKQRNG